MEFTAEIETDRLPSTNRMYTEYSFDLTEHRYQQLQIRLIMWRYFSLALTFTFMILIVTVALNWPSEICLVPLYIFDMAYWAWLHRTLKATEL